MTYEQAVEYIHSFVRFTPVRGHHRLRTLLEKLGNPQAKLRFVHITGTNGKGSAAVMTESILRAAGVKTGLFISPFVLDFRERIQTEGHWISKRDLVEGVETIRPFAMEQNATGDALNEFEIVTALGLWYFARQGCEIVCLEAGIGGENDSTNVIGTPLVSVIMKVSLDHIGVLGHTVEEIAREKAGIIKPCGITVTYPEQEDGALAVLMEACARRGNTLLIPNAAGVQVQESKLFGTRFCYGNHTCTVPFAGAHQVNNALTVLEIINALEQQGIQIPEEAVQKGMAAARFPARFEVLGEHPTIILDGAHNPDGMAALARTAKDCGLSRPVAILGMMRDKQVEQAVEKIAPLCKAVFTLTVDSPRAMSAKELKDIVSRDCPDVRPCKSPEQAFSLAKERAGKNGSILICGSLYLASEMRKLLCPEWETKDPAQKIQKERD